MLTTSWQPSLAIFGYVVNLRIFIKTKNEKAFVGTHKNP
uniref:Uncharacterized protein n=1 Tax=Anguilla anguilla TaxID=7936 RepID=A0A0E9R5S7_ANGAN